MIDLKNKVFLDSDGEMTFENKERLNFIMHFMKQGAVEQVATNEDGTFVRKDAEISFNEIWLPCAELKVKSQATPEGFVLELEKGRFVQYELIDLLTRSLSSSKVLKTNTNWVHVVRMLNVGSTVAHRICEKLGVDPESTKFEAQEQSHD